jgi:hypothetical protein
MGFFALIVLRSAERQKIANGLSGIIFAAQPDNGERRNSTCPKTRLKKLKMSVHHGQAHA